MNSCHLKKKVGGNKMKRKQVKGIFFLTIANVLFATPVFAADPSAKGFTSWILSSWVAPLFAVGVVFFVIKEISNQKWLQVAFLIVGGAVIYFFIQDPQGFLSGLSSIPQKFGF